MKRDPQTYGIPASVNGAASSDAARVTAVETYLREQLVLGNVRTLVQHGLVCVACCMPGHSLTIALEGKLPSTLQLATLVGLHHAGRCAMRATKSYCIPLVAALQVSTDDHMLALRPAEPGRIMAHSYIALRTMASGPVLCGGLSSCVLIYSCTFAALAL
jgi:hypothetical protein